MLLILHVLVISVGVCLQVVKADVFDDKSLKPVMEGQDAVVSCLGFPRKPHPVT